MTMLSRLAGSNTHGQDSSYFLGWEEYMKNPYDEVKNPDGMIQMGLAENQLSFDLHEKWIAKNPDASGFKRNGQSVFKELALFQDYHGLPEFKQALCDFMSQMRGNRVTFDPKNLVLTAGATSANETLIFCIAGPGDAILLPTPYYPGFDRDLKWRTGAEIIPINCTSSNNFKITKSAVEEAYQSAIDRDLNVKAILVTNPSNPLGVSLSREEVTLLINFISTNNIHLISDEIYAGTVFNSPQFVSAMDLLPKTTTKKSYSHLRGDDNNNNNDVSKRVHIVYSLSKDLGLPGFRVGAIYSSDTRIVSAATKMSSFGLISSQTQYLLSVMLSDTKFMSNYVSENQKRLKQRYETIVAGLKESGISCLEGNAGLFCWVDMRHLLKSNTFEGEMDLWKKILYEIKLNISPGSSCHCDEPGWFRVCFANMSEDTLLLAMQRVKAFIGAISMAAAAGGGKSHNQLKKSYHRRSLTKWVLRLSFDERERDLTEER